MDKSGLTLDCLPLTCQLVESDSILLNCRNHRGSLIKITIILGEGSFKLLRGNLRYRACLYHLPIGILGIGYLSQFHRADIFLVLAHQEILDLGATSEC